MEIINTRDNELSKRRRLNTYKHCNETPTPRRSIKARCDISTLRDISPDGTLGENYDSASDSQIESVGSRIPEVNGHHSIGAGNRISFIT